MRRGEPHSLDEASAFHYAIGKKVRETIKKWRCNAGGFAYPKKHFPSRERAVKVAEKGHKKLMLDE